MRVKQSSHYPDDTGTHTYKVWVEPNFPGGDKPSTFRVYRGLGYWNRKQLLAEFPYHEEHIAIAMAKLATQE